MAELHYQSGFGNTYASEAVAGALPVGRNSPQRVAHGLYAELLSGSAFTAPRAENRRTWMYRRQPSVVTGSYEALAHAHWKTGAKDGVAAPPNPMRWHAGAAARRAAGLHRRPAHDGRQRRCRCADRHGRAPGLDEQAHGPARAGQCRRRDAARAAAGPASCDHRTGRPRRRPGRGTAAAARPGLQGRRRWPLDRLRVRELRRAVPAARAGADRLQRPGQCARLPGAGGGLRSQ